MIVPAASLRPPRVYARYVMGSEERALTMVSQAKTVKVLRVNGALLGVVKMLYAPAGATLVLASC
jgi:hypothetical protein